MSFRLTSLNWLDYKHSYDSVDSGFAIKSLNFNVSRGQIVFITGANGSGKTTLMRVLTGLYTLQNGQITLDGQVISAPPPQAYRNLFSAVFADYHVFAKPYAIDSSKRVLLEEMLVKLRIRDKFSEDFLDKYSPETLSTGQHKRLALPMMTVIFRKLMSATIWKKAT